MNLRKNNSVKIKQHEHEKYIKDKLDKLNIDDLDYYKDRAAIRLECKHYHYKLHGSDSHYNYYKCSICGFINRI